MRFESVLEACRAANRPPPGVPTLHELLAVPAPSVPAAPAPNPSVLAAALAAATAGATTARLQPMPDPDSQARAQAPIPMVRAASANVSFEGASAPPPVPTPLPTPAAPSQAPLAAPLVTAPITAQPAAQTAPSSSAGPTASPQELLTIDLMLADPLNREIVAKYAGSAPLPPSAVTTEMVKHYGADRAGQMQQLAQAAGAVRQEYLKALDAASRLPSGVPRMGGTAPVGWSIVGGVVLVAPPYSAAKARAPRLSWVAYQAVNCAGLKL